MDIGTKAHYRNLQTKSLQFLYINIRAWKITRAYSVHPPSLISSIRVAAISACNFQKQRTWLRIRIAPVKRDKSIFLRNEIIQRWNNASRYIHLLTCTYLTHSDYIKYLHTPLCFNETSLIRLYISSSRQQIFLITRNYYETRYTWTKLIRMQMLR